MRINPRDPQLLFLLGMVLHKTGRSREALNHLEMAAKLQPQSARIFNGLGFVHQGLQDFSAARDYYSKAVELGMLSGDTLYSLGNVCYQLGEVEQAAANYQRAVELNPRDAASWNNLGKCLHESCLPEASIAAYDRALAADPDCFMARYGRAVSLLLAGRLKEGFCEYNQCLIQRLKVRQFPQPAWQGESAAGKTLFLHAEQGFGDAIQMVRFVRPARERVGNVILECRPELKTLFTAAGCADTVIAYGEAIPPFDCYTSLMSLPGILEVTLPTIPREMPYLKTPRHRHLPPVPAGHLKVGLCWAGSPTHHNDATRSVRLEDFKPILQSAAATFYSLQMPLPARDEACFRSGSPVVDLSEHHPDFLGTAVSVADLDLVISVDSAVAHLAGALGKPVWTLIPYAPDWRWLTNQSDTPWYPTMRLFRQPQRGQWQPVILKVAQELLKLNRRAAARC